uniref:Secreted protein n=1 Tax=Arundo donax TaxID=35708 RepID=A0A0A9HWR3_ARUDO
MDLRIHFIFIRLLIAQLLYKIQVQCAHRGWHTKQIMKKAACSRCLSSVSDVIRPKRCSCFHGE